MQLLEIHRLCILNKLFRELVRNVNKLCLPMGPSDTKIMKRQDLAPSSLQ